MRILQWMLLWQSSVISSRECRTQAPAWRKALHTTATHHLVQRQVLTSRKLHDDMGPNKGNCATTCSWKAELCDVMRLSRGTLCDYIRLNKRHYLMTWDGAKETMGWRGTERRKPSWYAAKQGNYETMWGWKRELCDVIGKNKGNSYITIKHTGSVLPETSHYKTKPEQR
jgi:hypothetical protein